MLRRASTVLIAVYVGALFLLAAFAGILIRLPGSGGTAVRINGMSQPTALLFIGAVMAVVALRLAVHLRARRPDASSAPAEILEKTDD